MPLHVSSTCAHRQEAKIVLYRLWYHHTYRWPCGAQIERGLDPVLSQSCKLLEDGVLTAKHIGVSFISIFYSSMFSAPV